MGNFLKHSSVASVLTSVYSVSNSFSRFTPPFTAHLSRGKKKAPQWLTEAREFKLLTRLELERIGQLPGLRRLYSISGRTSVRLHGQRSELITDE